MSNNEETNLIDIVSMLENFLKAVKKFWLAVIVGIVVITLGYYGYVRMSYHPVYQSQATFSVNADKSYFVNRGSLGLEQVKESLPYILQSDVMKNMVKEQMELEVFPAQMELASNETANLFVLKVSSADAKLSQEVMKVVLENLPRASVYVLGKIEIDILDESAGGSLVNYHNKRASLITGGVIGLFVCGIFLFIYAMTNHTIQKKEDFQKYLSISYIASIPHISFKKRRRQIDKHIHIYNDKVGYGFLEAIRTIRVRVEAETRRLNARTILITSSIPGEGKSTVASNLALSLAEKGARVVLVDLDLRNPSVGKVLGLEEYAKRGITDVLKGKRELGGVIHKIKNWNLSVVFCGEAQSDPTKMLSGGKIETIIDRLKEKYHYVILDTPPAAMLADASAIAGCADCAVYVVKQDYARIERVAEGMEALALAETPIVGAVLNDVENAVGGYGNYRYSHYGRYGAYGQAKDADQSKEYIDLEGK